LLLFTCIGSQGEWDIRLGHGEPIGLRLSARARSDERAGAGGRSVCAQEQDNKTARGTEGQAGADAHR